MERSEPATRRYKALAAQLDVLASEVRLELLHTLRRAKPLHEIQLRPVETSPGGGRGRPLARQTVAWHLDQLERLGLVVRTQGETAARGDHYALNHERLFATVDELHGLAKLRPIAGRSARPGSTVARSTGEAPRLPDLPRLVVAYGREDGVGYPLQGLSGAKWRIGRAADCEVRLDYDPYVSTENTLVERVRAGFLVRDLPSSRNGTWINWERLPKSGERPLRSGDVLIVGRTSLVFQA